MDQSVAIQETLTEGEYCIIISFPALSFPAPGPALALRSGIERVRICSPPSLCHQGRRKPVFTSHLVLNSLLGALNTQLSFQLPVKLGFIIPISQMGKAQRGKATCPRSHSESVWAREEKGRWGGLGGESPDCPFRSVSLDSELQAVQGVLCEGDSRQSRLLGLIRHRPENGGQEHA